MDSNTATKEETRAVVRKIVHSSREPLSWEELLESLPKLYGSNEKYIEEILKELRSNGKLESWKRRKKTCYWTKEAIEIYAKEQVLQLVAANPLSLSQVKKALKTNFFSYPKSKVDEMAGPIVKKLLANGEVYEHPRGGRVRAKKISSTAPDPCLYLNKAKREFEYVAKKLAKSGLSRKQVLLGLESLVLPKAEQRTEPCEARKSRLEGLQREILSKIHEVEPRAREEALVSLSKLRELIDASKESFDEAVLSLAKAEKLFLHRHVHPSEMSPSKRAQMVEDARGNVYMGVVLRSG